MNNLKTAVSCLNEAASSLHHAIPMIQFAGQTPFVRDIAVAIAQGRTVPANDLEGYLRFLAIKVDEVSVLNDTGWTP